VSIVPLFEAQKWLDDNRSVFKGAKLQVPERALRLAEASFWIDMMSRCYNPEDPHFLTFGGRSITVDDDWHLFAVFLADMGYCPDGFVLARHNVDAGYVPGNAFWTHPLQPPQLRL
jgi:hypothetical protein